MSRMVITAYKILADTDAKKLGSKVNEMVREFGWRPWGPPSHLAIEGKEKHFQAVVKHREEI